MRFLLVALVLCNTLPLLGQTPLFTEEGPTKRAVVVGISKYQDKRIDPLMFADKDAQAFASFLQSPSGGSVPPENIRLLLNEKATSGDLWRELQWLMDTSKEGDQAFIYFSGHGDKETATKLEMGFLLTFNSPYNLYPGGAFSLTYLKAAVETLEANGVDVVLITDACRSGKLAGNSIGGNGATTAALANSFDKTIKILSCQPNEFSLEGTQWDGGRGAFSFHLIEGMMGLADSEPDGIITLREIERYLEQTVTREAAPKEQNPFTVGDKTAIMAYVDKKVYKRLIKEKEVELPSFEGVNTRGYEEGIVDGLDNSVSSTYNAFIKTLDGKQLMAPADSCTDLYYRQLMDIPEVEKIWKTITRNYAAALQDGSLEAYNDYLKSDSSQLAKLYKEDERFFLYPAYLARASEILGPNHYMYKSLKARQLYFEGLVKRVQYSETGKPEAVLQEAISSQEESLEYESNNATALYELGVLKYRDGYIDKAIEYLEKAAELAPTWSLPYDRLGAAYLDAGQFSKARDMYAKALELSPDELLGYAYRNLGYAYQQMGDLDQAEKNYIEARDRSPDDPFIHYYLGSLYRQTGNLEKAVLSFNTTLQLDPKFAAAYYYLGLVYQDNHQYDLAEKVLQRAVADEPGNFKYHYHLGINYFYLENYEQALAVLQKVEILKPDFTYTYYYLGMIYKAQGEAGKARLTFEKALMLDPTDAENYYQLGILLYEEEKYTQAVEKLKQAIERDQGFYYAHYYLGMTKLKQAKLSEAAASFETSLTLAPNDPMLYYQIGVVYFEQGKWDQALDVLEKAASIDPGFGLTYYTMGLVYKSKGDMAKGEELLEKARTLGVDF